MTHFRTESRRTRRGSAGPRRRIGVLQVVISYSPGGGERTAIEVATRLADRFRMVACCLDDVGAWAPRLTERGIEVVPLHRAPGFHPSLGWRIAQLAAKHDVQVLHCHQYSPYVYGSLAALMRPTLRVVVTEQGRLSTAPASAKRRLANRMLGRVPSRVFAVSEDLRADLIHDGFPTGRVEVLHNCIEPGPEPTLEARRRARQVLGIGGSQYVIGTIARLDPVKDLGTLVRAFALLRRDRPDAVLALVGDGPEREGLEALVNQLQLGGSVRLAGHRDDARSLLAGFDLYVNCSVTEGTSLTIMEAMAACVPVVATHVGGTAEIVVDGTTGLLVPAEQPTALAAAIDRVAVAPDVARSLGRAGRQRVERHFAIDGMIARYAESYEAFARPPAGAFTAAGR